MKKTKKTLMTAAALCAAANIAAPMSANAFGNTGNSKTVYEAPEVEYVEDTELPSVPVTFKKIGENEGKDSVLSDMVDYTPDIDRVPVVYGPPDWFDDLKPNDDDKKDDDDSSYISRIPFDPEDRVPLLYGPPDYYLIKGDLTGDNKIDIEDAVNLLGSISGDVKLDASQSKAADVNNDGKIDVEDAANIVNHINGVKPIK